MINKAANNMALITIKSGLLESTNSQNLKKITVFLALNSLKNAFSNLMIVTEKTDLKNSVCLRQPK